MSYNRNNNRGGYGQNRNGGFRGNGNGNYGGGNRQGNDAGKYVESGVKKYVSDDNGKQAVDLDEFLTEELGFSLTNEKALDLIAKLQGAIATSEVGGAYIKMYLSRKQNGRTGEKFNGVRILVNKQDAPNDRFQRGNFRGNAGGGRRDYPQNNYQNGNGGYNNGGANMNHQASTGNNYNPTTDYQERRGDDPAPTTGHMNPGYQGNNAANEPEF